MKKTYALVVGGAACVWDDLNYATNLGYQADFVVIVNDIGVNWAGRIDHWCSYHSDQLQIWIEKRQKAGLKPATKLWTGPVRPRHIKAPMQSTQCKGGSSGYLGTTIALQQGATHVLLCGIPIDPTMQHFNAKNQNRPWTDGKHYQKNWKDNADKLQGKVKSFGGFTRRLLGAPTLEWIES